MTKMVYYTKHDRGLTLFYDGKSRTVSSDDQNYSKILDALREKKFDVARKLMSVGETIAEAAASVANGKQRITIEGNRVMYTDGVGSKRELLGPLVDRIIDSVTSGATAASIKPLMLFMDNLQKNRLKDIREELYQFMQSGKMPITQDGCFLAYKKVRADYKDCHSGTMDNSPGKLVQMKPEDVDTDRHNLCSRGLHFCSRSYLSSFGGQRTVVVKVNPRFVFAIPTDYNNAKGRASEYYVVGECTGDPAAEEAFLEPFIFDETLTKAAPKVKFVPSGLKPSLTTMAEGYKLVKKGKAFVRVEDSKGGLPSAKYSIVRKDGKEFISAITGKVVPKEHVKEMSVTTKSVRAALVRAVARGRHK